LTVVKVICTGPVTLGGMPVHRPLHQHTFWSLDALSRADVLALLDIARTLKHANGERAGRRPLEGKNLAIIGDPAADGRLADFCTAASELGVQIAKVSADDTRTRGDARAARMLGRLYDAIDCEGLDAETVQQIENEAGVPVFNGLADDAHPTRVLATLLELERQTGLPLPQLRVAFLGDPRTARGDALLQAAGLTGIELRIAAPRAAWPESERLAHARRCAQGTPARLLVTESAAEATDGAHAVLDERIQALAATAPDQRYTLQAMLLTALG
jgi:ornithine carbamoyltransferase